MSSASPIVSVVIPTKNRAGLLREALASLVAQTYPDWEAIVVDDKSTDGTVEQVQALALADGRIRLVRREQRSAGASACRNQGVAAARGEYVIFMDSDDALAPGCLAGRVKFMAANPGLDFGAFMTRIFSATPGDNPCLWNLFTEEDDLDRFLRFDPPWHTSGPIWRKASLAKIGLWDERALSAQDWEFHVRALAAGANYRKVTEVDSYWRTSWSGAMGKSWSRTRQVCNRVRLFRRIWALLRARGLWTERRRRILAGEFHDHAFRSGLKRGLMVKVWNAGRRAGIVGNVEFAVVLFSESAVWLAKRANQLVLRRLFPEQEIAKTNTVVRLPETEKNLPNRVDG
jgi:glycosyltransferase involved in cell wall biosynthesis